MLEELLCVLNHLFVVDKDTLFRFSADVDVLRNSQVVHHIQLLMYDADTRRLRLRNVFELDRLSEKLHLSAVPRIYSA